MKLPVLSVKPGTVQRLLTIEEAAQIAVRWLDAFGQDREGVNADSFMWHVFSSGRFPSERGAAAIAQYKLQSAHEYLVLSNDRKTAFTTMALPESCSLTDVYVFPANLAWTMAFTHEDGWLGPFFARHRDFERLSRENQSRLRKAQEAEAARRKGWR